MTRFRSDLRHSGALRIPALAALGCALTAVAATSVPGQVPSGTYLYAAPVDLRAPSPPGCGGLFLLDPANPAMPTAISGLPPEVSGCTATTGRTQGTSWAIEDPATGDVFVNGGLANAPLSVYRLRINATANPPSANVVQQWVLGNQGLSGTNRDALMLPDGRLLLAFVNPLTGTTPFAGQVLGILDPSQSGNAALTPVSVTHPSLTTGLPISVALAPDHVDAFLAVVQQATGTTDLLRVPLPPAAGPATLLSTLPLPVTNKLLREPEGAYLLGGKRGVAELYRFDPATGATTRFGPLFATPTQFIGGLGIDPVTGDLLLAVGDLDFTRGTNTTSVYVLPGRSPNAVPVLLSAGPPGGWGGAFSGFVTSSTLHVHGRPTNSWAMPVPDARWSVAPNVGGAPVPGNTGFQLQVDNPAAGSPQTNGMVGAALLGFATTNLPFLGLTLYVGGPNVFGVPVTITGTTATLPLPVPPQPALRGAEIHAQMVFINGFSTPHLLTATPGLRIRIQ